LCGCIGLYFWIFTDHWAAHRNENALAYSPLGLLLAACVPGLVGRAPRRTRVAIVCAAAIGALSLLALIAQALPTLNQVNGEPLALVLPMNIALAWTVWSYSRNYATQPAQDGALKVETP
jgi:hypothetical protein